MTEADKENKIPLALLVAGQALIALAAWRIAGAGSVAAVLTTFEIAAVVTVIVQVIAAFITATILKTSFGELKSAVLKLAAIYMFSSGLQLNIPTVGGLIATATAFSLMLWLFGLEIYEAIIFGVVSWVVALLTASVILSALR